MVAFVRPAAGDPARDSGDRRLRHDLLVGRNNDSERGGLPGAADRHGDHFGGESGVDRDQHEHVDHDGGPA